MGCDFTVMDRQLDAPRGPAPGGKLVLCNLKGGSSMIGAPAPSVKLVLEGDPTHTYAIRDEGNMLVKPGQEVAIPIRHGSKRDIHVYDLNGEPNKEMTINVT